MALCLVTGHQGYIGSDLYAKLINLGHDAISLSDGLIEDVRRIAVTVGENFDRDKITNSPKW